MRSTEQATLAYNGPFMKIADRETAPRQERGRKPVEVNVVFSHFAGAARAMAKAAELTKDLNARIRVMVPQVVPYPRPLRSPPVLVEFSEQRFLEMAATQDVETHVDIYLCRDSEVLLPPRSLVILGGRKRIWPTWETRLAKKLIRRGHVVVLAALPAAYEGSQDA